MAADDREPPSKRARLALPPSAVAIAGANETLRFLTGARHNRWMQQPAATDKSGSLAQTPSVTTQPAHAAATVAAAASQPRHPQTHSVPPFQNPQPGSSLWPEYFSTAPELVPSLVSHQNPVPPVRGDLVAYETSPHILSASTVPSSVPSSGSAINGRNSVDSARNANPGLPSPAPSDENLNSPRLPLDQFLQQSRPQSTAPTRTPGEAPGARALPQVASPSAPYPPPHSATIQQQVAHQAYEANRLLLAQQRHHQQLNRQARPEPEHARSLPHNGQPILSAPNFNAPGQGSTAQQFPTLPSNARPSSAQHPQTLVAAPASRIPASILLRAIDEKTTALRQAGVLSSTDNGRLLLLREAVRREDWFYQVLSQLYCLRSVSPALLPRLIRSLPGQCYKFVEGLLCANNAINPDLLNFFAHFPEPIMDIYSDQQQDFRQAYEGRMMMVKIFLTKLAESWLGLANKCKQMLAPPLVQDLVEVLNMRSPVLQTTVFRAIARMIYGAHDHDAPGIAAVEGVHQTDQESFYGRSFWRTAAEKTVAYSMLRRVYEHWTTHLRRTQAEVRIESQTTAAQFELPTEVREFFVRMPNSLVLAQLQQRQLQAQNLQAQTMSAQSASPGELQELQQRFLQSQASNIPGPGSPVNGRVPLNPMRPGTFASPPVHQANALMSSSNPLHPQPPGQCRQFYPSQAEIPRPQPTHPDTTRIAVHQAHLRSPRLKPAEKGGPQLYRHVVGFALPPTCLQQGMPSQSIRFGISKAQIKRLPKAISLPEKVDGGRQREIGERSLMYRLRCCVLPRAGFANGSDWVTTDNYWPEDLAFEVNDTRLELRKKLHHGRYLPVDLTDILKPGENTLKTFNLRKKDDKRPAARYVLAVETVGVISRPKIMEKATRISEEDSITAIKRSLRGSVGADDEDDLVMTSSTLNIKLFDPYSACKIFDIPVRGANCLHRDCFDLETFLTQCKRQQPDWPIVDCWRCPICRGDVRPQTMIIDGFLVGVREQLESRGQLDTRAIVVEADGSWKVREEETCGIRSPSLEREEQASAVDVTGRATAPPRRPIEVIELE